MAEKREVSVELVCGGDELARNEADEVFCLFWEKTEDDDGGMDGKKKKNKGVDFTVGVRCSLEASLMDSLMDSLGASLAASLGASPGVSHNTPFFCVSSAKFPRCSTLLVDAASQFAVPPLRTVPASCSEGLSPIHKKMIIVMAHALSLHTNIGCPGT